MTEILQPAASKSKEELVFHSIILVRLFQTNALRFFCSCMKRSQTVPSPQNFSHNQYWTCTPPPSDGPARQISTFSALGVVLLLLQIKAAHARTFRNWRSAPHLCGVGDRKASEIDRPRGAVATRCSCYPASPVHELAKLVLSLSPRARAA